MITVQRANVILQINDEPDIVQKYRDKGFDIIDGETGKVLEKAVPHETGALQALVLDLKAELQEKEQEIKKLKAELQKAKSTKRVAKTTQESQK